MTEAREGAGAPAVADWRDSLARGNYEEAAGRLRALELVGAGNPEALRGVEAAVAVVKALRARDYAGALEAAPRLRQAGLVEIDTGGLTEALENLRAAEAKRRDLAACRALLEAALTSPLARAEAENNLGVLEANAGNTDLAREHFERALVADARHHRAITNLGNLLLEGGDLAGAEARYREAIRLAPEYSTAHNNLAAALRRQGKRAESVASLKRAQKLALKEGGPGGRSAPGGAARPAGAGGGLKLNPYVRWFLIGALVVLLYRLLMR